MPRRPGRARLDAWPPPSTTGSPRRSSPGTRSGNLVLAGLMDAAGDPVAALDEACRLLGVPGRVLPATTEPVVLKADADERPGGRPGRRDGHRQHPHGVAWCPATPAPPRRRRPLAAADQIVLGPGSLFTSVLAAVAVPDIRARRSTAPGPSGSTSATCAPRSPRPRASTSGMHVDALRRPRGRRWTWCSATPRGSAARDPAVPVVDVPLGAAPTGWPTIRSNWRQPSLICSDDAQVHRMP